MAPSPIIAAAPPGTQGFDCNTTLSTSAAKQFAGAGFAFAIRYLSRGEGQGSGDLSAAETSRILGAGLAVMAVQHVAPAGWTPTADLGSANGRNAASNAGEAGLIPGVSVWLDLEGVNHAAAAEDVIAYCNAWFREVEPAGFIPGIYVGANAILSGDQLFWRLKTKHYWKSGSNVPDIPQRGYQMTQRIVKKDIVAGIEIDRNVTRIDSFGDTVRWMANPPKAMQ